MKMYTHIARYRPFAGGGVAEFLAAHGVALDKFSSRNLACLQSALAHQLTDSPSEDFCLEIGGSRLIFEGPDEKGSFYHLVNETMRRIHADS